jgi:ubiquinone/menaquinone biosynthesis C-methylase UbiE
MTSTVEYNEEESKRTEQAYLSPEIVRQRKRTLELMAPVPGERILDVGCGPGLLALELSAAVGGEGNVIGIDASPAMIGLAEKRCCHLENVKLAEGDATNLAIDDASVDVVCCTQVLLYVGEHQQAISEMYRVLKPGGRVVILETDWRSTVLHSNDEALTEKIIEAWDNAVPSPRLPARLGPLLRDAGFESIQVEVIPNVSTSCEKGGFSLSMMEQCAQAAFEQGIISVEKRREWLADLLQLGADDAYFFCVNRFVFSAVKSG